MSMSWDFSVWTDVPAATSPSLSERTVLTGYGCLKVAKLDQAELLNHMLPVSGWSVSTAHYPAVRSTQVVKTGTYPSNQKKEKQEFFQVQASPAECLSASIEKEKENSNLAAVYSIYCRVRFFVMLTAKASLKCTLYSGRQSQSWQNIDVRAKQPNSAPGKKKIYK